MLSEASLWTVICLGTPGYELGQNPEPAASAKVLQRQQELMELFVQRSSERPLSFVLRFELDAEMEGDRLAADRLVAEVVRLSNRWDFLSARCHANLMPMISRKADFHFEKSHVRQLHLDLTGPIRELLIDIRFVAAFKTLVSMDFQDVSQELTKLRVQGGLDLQVNNFWMPRLEVGPIATSLTCFIYQQPLKLDYSPMTFNDALTILARCQLLETFEYAATVDTPFKICIPETPYWDNKEHVLKLGLTRLSLSSTKNLEFGPLLSILDAPKLEVLCLKGPLYAEWMAVELDLDLDLFQDWDHVNRFLERSPKPQLAKLHLEGLPLSAESAAGVLDISPHVNDLKLDGRVFDSRLVSRLTWAPGAEKDINLLPNLRSLAVVGCSTTHIRVAELVDMVRSRVKCAHPIPFGDKDNLAAHEQSKQQDQESVLAGIVKIYLADTKDPLDVECCVEARHFFFTDPIMMWFVSKGYIDIKIGDA